MKLPEFPDVFEETMRNNFKPKLYEMWDMLPADCDHASVLRAGVEERLIPMALARAPDELFDGDVSGRFRRLAPKLMRKLLEEVISEKTA